MSNEVVKLKEALRQAILNTHRVDSRCVEVDPAAGSTYELTWSNDVKRWAALCDLDLSEHDPCYYRRA